jgi:hypothetical protein
MEVRVENKDGTPVQGIKPVVAEIQQRLQDAPQKWLQALQADPRSFADLEVTVHHAFQKMADQLVAGLLAQATQGDDFAQTAKKK